MFTGSNPRLIREEGFEYLLERMIVYHPESDIDDSDAEGDDQMEGSDEEETDSDDEALESFRRKFGYSVDDEDEEVRGCRYIYVYWVCMCIKYIYSVYSVCMYVYIILMYLYSLKRLVLLLYYNPLFYLDIHLILTILLLLLLLYCRMMTTPTSATKRESKKPPRRLNRRSSLADALAVVMLPVLTRTATAK